MRTSGALNPDEISKLEEEKTAWAGSECIEAYCKIHKTPCVIYIREKQADTYTKRVVHTGNGIQALRHRIRPQKECAKQYTSVKGGGGEKDSNATART